MEREIIFVNEIKRRKVGPLQKSVELKVMLNERDKGISTILNSHVYLLIFFIKN